MTCIQNDNITVLRRAQKNKQVCRRSQLTVLWKLELKNLLIKNNMPLYAQKNRGYISERIAATVEDSLLGKQIAQELMRRDYSVCNANDFTIYSKGGDGFPAEEIMDMLSEKNLEQFILYIPLYSRPHDSKRYVSFFAPRLLVKSWRI